MLRRADGARRCLYQDHVQSRTVLWGLRSPEKTSALVGGLQQSPDTEVGVKANVCGSLSHRCFPHWMTLELLPRKPRNRRVTARALRLRERNQRQRSHRRQGGPSGALDKLIK
ncbi:uncharacterized protein ISCGN_002266 [Ixodes scapularis]